MSEEAGDVFSGDAVEAKVGAEAQVVWQRLGLAGVGRRSWEGKIFEVEFEAFPLLLYGDVSA